ncbi:MAG: glycosyltransferase [Saprospiraceae bacterium]|nr:glycosyltransferase [Saprospiraceae bacterium]
MDRSVVLLIPMYNPPSGWDVTLLNRYHTFCRLFGQKIPLVLSNDGSSIDIQEGVQNLQNNLGSLFNYVSSDKNQGKGAALKRAAAYIQADTYLFTDHDFPYTPESMIAVLQNSMSKGGITMGVRDDNYYDDISFFRTHLSKLLKKLNLILLRLPSNDTQCGLKAFDNSTKNILLNCKTNRFLIDLEFLLAANSKNVSITPVVVKLRSDVAFTRFNAWVLSKELGNFLLLIWNYRIRKQK